ncbi:FAD-binding domain protein [Ceratobasidium sp. AG-Ba]|nr:FAD-binding domain protein [Ceratobasidium sp. AG-Ba]
MRLSFYSIFALPLLGFSVASDNGSETRAAPPPYAKYRIVCEEIKKKGVGVYYPGTFLWDPLYTKGNSHWASSSDQNATCVVEPANAKDVSEILKIVGKTSTPFGVRSGGHTTNQGFSSTLGVLIALFKFSQVIYHPKPLAADGSVGTVEIGAGLIWDDVYGALEPHKVTAVGGRVTGIGVGGFILGGGYSFLSNQYGLAIDTISACEVVLPDGTITTASETKNPDLFFGLKGGFNNFGIVTKFILLAFPQGQVWGGIQTFAGDQISAVSQATVDFIAKVKDPKASVLPSFFSVPVNGSQSTGANILLFYDGPTPPGNIFERFTSIPNIASDVSTRSMNSLIASSSANTTYGLRSTFKSVSLKTYTIPLLQEIVNQARIWGNRTLQQGVLLSYAVEPFLPSMSQRSKGGAYPHDNFLSPFNVNWYWTDESIDTTVLQSIKQSAQAVLDAAIAEGQDVAGDKQIQYGNYQPADEDLKLIYGSNLGRLRKIKKKYDPGNVMRLAGGFRF